MPLSSLHVYHHRKGVARELPRAEHVRGDGIVFLDTCQRLLWISSGPAHVTDGAFEIFRGAEAYRFLLSVACGLESRVLGETDVFGQVKECWKQQAAQSHPTLKQWMPKIFEDTKDIRARYIQNWGGVSYGSLVRKLLLEQKTAEPTLLVGAGQIAHSVAPYLAEEGELWIANRSRERLDELISEVAGQAVTRKRASSAPVRAICDEAAELDAWRTAARIVVAVPHDEARDALRREAFLRGDPNRVVVHLGGLREFSGEWPRLARFFALDQLFDLQRSQDAKRASQMVQAFKACDERARLRSLSLSNAVMHGWEDLAVFA